MAIAAGGIFAIWLWQAPGRPPIVPPSLGSAMTHTAHNDVQVTSSTSVALTSRPGSPERKVAPRELFRASRDYAKLVHDLAAAATAGDATAEYLTANALRYCDERLKMFRRSNGSIRSLNEVQARWANRPVGYQQAIMDAYERCHEFQNNPADQEPTSSWHAWLDKAVAAGFPPAQSEKADDMRDSEMLRDAANATAGDVVPPTMGPARDLALAASTSGDPDTIFCMANWVDGTTHSQEDYVDLTSAWTLLACQRGYDDCGPNSEWIRSMCNWDPQCVDVNNATDYLQRRLGSHFDEVQNLVKQIGLAVDAKDLKAIESYLYTTLARGHRVTDRPALSLDILRSIKVQNNFDWRLCKP